MVDDWEPVWTGRGELIEMGDTGEWEKSAAVGVRTGFVSRGRSEVFRGLI